ncbi:unnamed protein product [Durusdinium trenchii]|uniref:Poly [ADP-ribose] polymerase n=1 Tax=Durusdinium trenchii TaxID=1381693 RepID=A0ABP0HSQ6_9DINO
MPGLPEIFLPDVCSTSEATSPSRTSSGRSSGSHRGFRWKALEWQATASESEGDLPESEASREASRSSSIGSQVSCISPRHRFSWKAPSRSWSPEERSDTDAQAAILLQAHWRGTMVRRLHRKHLVSAAVLVAHLRAWHMGRQERKCFLRLKAAVLRLQRFLRERRSFQTEEELMTSEMLVSCEVGPEIIEVMTEGTEGMSATVKPGGCYVRPALRGAARRKLLGEEVTLPGVRSPEGRAARRTPRKSCGPTPEKKTRNEASLASPSPAKEVEFRLGDVVRLDSGALVLSELLAQGLLVQEEMGDHLELPIQRALQELSSRHARICFLARLEGVQGSSAGAALRAAYAAAKSSLGPERLLWHGTSWDCVPNIVRHGFNRAYAFNARHGSKLGRGVYFADDPGYALRFAGKCQTRAVLLAGVLPGRFTRGKEGLLEAPAMPAMPGLRFDSTCDDASRPRVFCVFKDFQALPLYLLQVAM